MYICLNVTKNEKICVMLILLYLKSKTVQIKSILQVFNYVWKQLLDSWAKNLISESVFLWQWITLFSIEKSNKLDRIKIEMFYLLVPSRDKKSVYAFVISKEYFCSK